MNVTLPDALTFIVPLLVTMLSHFLRDAKLPASANGLIALASMVVTAVVCVWLSGSWTGDPQVLTTSVLLYVGYLSRNDFQALMAWLFASDSPVAPAQPQNSATTIVASSGTFAYPVDQMHTAIGTPLAYTENYRTQDLSK